MNCSVIRRYHRLLCTQHFSALVRLERFPRTSIRRKPRRTTAEREVTLHPQCRCSECWTLREYMQSVTGKTYGLEPAKGHTRPVRPVSEPSNVVTLPVPKPEPPQPWMPRRSRFAPKRAA